jgi:hypothetical protein
MLQNCRIWNGRKNEVGYAEDYLDIRGFCVDETS